MVFQIFDDRIEKYDLEMSRNSSLLKDVGIRQNSFFSDESKLYKRLFSSK